MLATPGAPHPTTPAPPSVERTQYPRHQALALHLDTELAQPNPNLNPGKLTPTLMCFVTFQISTILYTAAVGFHFQFIISPPTRGEAAPLIIMHRIIMHLGAGIML